MPDSPNSVAALRRDAILLGMPEHAVLLLVHTAAQLLELSFPDGIYAGTFPVSTSQFGSGQMINSYKTPRGFHEIVERYGEREPLGMVFESRKPTGLIIPENQWREPTGDKILTRILRLAGREPGLNQGGDVDSYDRMIYLHGTNQEHYVGVKPMSRGCIRLRNRDIVALYDLLSGHSTWCWIGELSRGM